MLMIKCILSGGHFKLKHFITFTKYGIGRRNNTNTRDSANGTSSNLFNNPSVAQCSTNQYGFGDLGSWVYDLNEGVRKCIPALYFVFELENYCFELQSVFFVCEDP